MNPEIPPEKTMQSVTVGRPQHLIPVWCIHIRLYVPGQPTRTLKTIRVQNPRQANAIKSYFHQTFGPIFFWNFYQKDNIRIEVEVEPETIIIELMPSAILSDLEEFIKNAQKDAERERWIDDD